MLNNLVLVGRLVDDVEVIETENENKIYHIVLAIPRQFKNAEGIYETDFIPCILYNVIGKNTNQLCKKGDLVGIKGRLESQGGKVNIIAEKVTFLSSNKKEEE